jgi:hypothetical protein
MDERRFEIDRRGVLYMQQDPSGAACGTELPVERILPQRREEKTVLGSVADFREAADLPAGVRNARAPDPPAELRNARWTAGPMLATMGLRLGLPGTSGKRSRLDPRQRRADPTRLDRPTRSPRAPPHLGVAWADRAVPAEDRVLSCPKNAACCSCFQTHT